MTTSRKFLRDHLYSHRRHVFLERDFSKPFRSYGQKLNYTRRMLEGKQELDKFRLHFSSSIDGIADLFERGCLGSAAFVDGELVGFMWYRTGELYEAKYNYNFRMSEGEVYQTAGYWYRSIADSWSFSKE